MRDMYAWEYEPGRGVARIAQAADAGPPELLEALEVDVEHAKAGRDTPDVGEGDAGEVAAPQEGQRDGADQSHHTVTAHLGGKEMEKCYSLNRWTRWL